MSYLLLKADFRGFYIQWFQFNWKLVWSDVHDTVILQRKLQSTENFYFQLKLLQINSNDVILVNI